MGLIGIYGLFILFSEHARDSKRRDILIHLASVRRLKKEKESALLPLLSYSRLNGLHFYFWRPLQKKTARSLQIREPEEQLKNFG